jgi:hypothetical protein
MSEESTPPNEQPTPAVAPPEDEVLVIRLQRKQKNVTIEDENGVVRPYVVREMMGNIRDQWLNTMAERMKLDKSGTPVGVKEFKGLQTSLICRCLYDQNGKLIPETTIANWPASAQKALFEMCQKLSGLDDSAKDKEAQEKNS